MIATLSDAQPLPALSSSAYFPLFRNEMISHRHGCLCNSAFPKGFDWVKIWNFEESGVLRGESLKISENIGDISDGSTLVHR